MKKKRVFFCIIIIFSICAFGQILYSNNIKKNTIIVLNDDAVLYSTPLNETQPVYTVDFFDSVTIVKSTVINNKLYVITKNNIKGWIRINDTSYLADDWISFDKLEEIIIYLPKNLKFNYFKGNKLKDNAGIIRYERKLSHKDYYIYVVFNQMTFRQYLKNRSNSYELHKNERVKVLHSLKKIIVNNLSCFYNEEINYTNKVKGFGLIIEPKKDLIISMTILAKGQVTKDQDLLARKILFSIRAKKSNFFSELFD